MSSELLNAISLGRFLGVPVEAHLRLGSTNDEALRRAREGAPEGLVVVAEDQSAGRGRHGRSWFGSPGQSLLFSVLLRPRLPLAEYPLLALALACAVADSAGEAIGVPLAVKWPNDVLHGGKKAAGVLAESRVLAGGESPVLVIGAGVNVNQLEGDFPAEIRGLATSLRIVGGGMPIAIPGLLAAALARFEESAALGRGGESRPLFERLRPRLPSVGDRVRVRIGERLVEGSVVEVTGTGALRVRNHGSGAVETLAAGVLE